ncbi:MAG TPA: dihydrolipoyl dehydrogenase, partial [Rhodocyclaceae bacterium]|nr:dihydrolipoyl dehydrogenase [Rhodocyclaceae bacterium]
LDSDDTLIGEVDFARQGRARAAQRNEGLMRIYAQRGTGALLGAEMCAPAGEHMAHLLALAIERGLTVHDLLRMPFYHPVLEEGLRTALRELAAQLPPAGDSDLAACPAFQADALD